MSVPSHGDICQTIRNYATTCLKCKEKVFYFECSCGSKVFFDSCITWEKHDCSLPISQTYHSFSLKGFRFSKNKREGIVHNGQKVFDKNFFEVNSTDGTKNIAMETCRYCSARVKVTRMKKHIKKVHPTKVYFAED